MEKLREKLKVKPWDIYLRNKFYKFFAALSAFLGVAFLVIDLPKNVSLPHNMTMNGKCLAAIVLIIFLIITYAFMWWRANSSKEISIKVDATDVVIKEGDLFKENGLIAIGFNEYFDTIVDDRIIAKKSLNGLFINNIVESSIEALDSFIESNIDNRQKLEVVNRARGNNQKYKIGTVCLYLDKYILTAFAKFNDRNEARLTMPEYLEFLINFWDEVNSIYAARSVSVPIFGSGITRIKEHKNTTDEQLLKIMLWTFKISEMKFTHPARLTIVVHRDKMKAINLTSIEGLSNGL